MTAIGEGTPTPGCETSQAMAIFYNIFTEEEKPAAYKVLLDKIHEQNDHLDTGVLGARVIFHVLTAFGDSDLAYKIITDKTYPSYGSFVVRGETSLPEDFNNENQHVNSRNHHFFGDISAWFIKCICGINYNPDADDLTRADITPHFVTDLSHAEAYHECPMGKIAVKWERTDDNTIKLDVTYPEVCTVSSSLTAGHASAAKRRPMPRAVRLC
jgi:alpha-L-rhamnosidase